MEPVTNRRLGVSVKHKHGLQCFLRPVSSVFAMAPGLALGVAGHVMRVDCQHMAAVMAAGAADAPHCQFQIFGVPRRVPLQQVVNCHVAGNKVEAVGDLESFLTDGDSSAEKRAQRRLVDQVQGQARRKVVRARATTLSTQHIPRSQTEQLWQQQPYPGHVARDFVSQQLPNGSLNVVRRAWLRAKLAPGALRLNFSGSAQCRVHGVEPFFGRPYSVITRSTLRTDICTPSCFSF